jgi:Cdc6-like AAA superfamily ATPase
MASQQHLDLGIEAGKVFTPTAPIDEKALFAGRIGHVRQVLDVVNQRGQHAIIFGERGVGKTSLANVLSDFLGGPSNSVISPRVNCDALDDFASVWKKVLGEIQVAAKKRLPGLQPRTIEESFSARELLESGSPNDVQKALQKVAESALPIVIIDEFDRLRSEVKAVFADTIKALSDHAVEATVILVGVADSVDELIKEHHSVERALVQIRMPRMSKEEIEEIIHKGLTRLTMTIDADAIDRVALLSQGLPHYTHLLGLHAAREALDRDSKNVMNQDVEVAIRKSLDQAQQTIRSAYHKATMSPRRDNLFAEVLLACAVSSVDEMGYFAASDVRNPIRTITRKQYEIPSYSRHLKDFCEERRGPILQRIGGKRRTRFRFVNPLMQPFVVMQGIASNMITAEDLQVLQPSA